tara:strand:+ start:542 stop:991 length:450 start_codon:yes stop_codon:yes gene_type:complete
MEKISPVPGIDIVIWYRRGYPVCQVSVNDSFDSMNIDPNGKVFTNFLDIFFDCLHKHKFDYHFVFDIHQMSNLSTQLIVQFMTKLNEYRELIDKYLLSTSLIVESQTMKQLFDCAFFILPNRKPVNVFMTDEIKKMKVFMKECNPQSKI